MGNSTLTSRAKSLELDLQSKLKCYVRVGWMIEEKSEIYMVYVDRRASIRDKDIPGNWFGNVVKVQEVYPPGTRPDPDPGPAW